MNLVFMFLNMLPILFFYQLSGSIDFSYALTNELTLTLKETPLGTFFAYLSLLSVAMISIAQLSRKYTCTHHLLQLLLSVSMVAIVMSGDFVTFFISWEVMTWTSYFLIAQSTNSSARTMQKYIIFSIASAFFLIAGMMVSFSFANSFEFTAIHNVFTSISFGGQVAIIVLLAMSFLIKSGAIGLHYWVVDAYSQAGDLFSAILSAVMSKMGIFGLFLLFGQIVGYANLKDMFGTLLNGSSFGYALALLGIATSIIATFKAIRQDEVKRLLAYSSIAQLGYIVAVIGFGTTYGIAGAMYHTLLHTIIKLLLFINVAAIIAQTGKTKFSQLGGLIYRTPVSFVMLLIGIIGLAGFPPLGGFASKFMIYNAFLDAKFAILLVGVLFSGAASFLYCYKLIYGIYLGHPNSEGLEETKEVHASYLIPQIILAGLLLAIGTFPGVFVSVMNPILESFALAPLVNESAGTMLSFIGEYNGLAVMSIFGIVFVLVLILVMSLKSKTKNNLNRFDFSYCGEVPNKKTSLHFGYGIGAELHRINFINAILKRTSANFYESIVSIIAQFGNLFSRFYRGSIHDTAIIILLFFALLYFVGVN